MGLKFLNPTPAWNGVAAGLTATCELVTGKPRYFTIWLRLQTTVASAVPTTIAGFLGDVRLKMDGTPQRTRSALEINRINLLNDPYGGAFITRDDAVAAVDPNEVVSKVKADGTFTVALTATATFKYTLHLPITFNEPYREEYTMKVIPALPTAWPNGQRPFGSLQLEADIPATLQAPRLTSDWFGDNVPGMVDSNGNAVLKLSKWYTRNFPFTSSGDLAMKLNWAGRYQDLHLIFAVTSPQTTALEILAQIAGVPDVIKADNGRLNMLGHHFGMDPFNTLYLPNWASLVFDVDDDLNSGVVIPNGVHFTITAAIRAVKTATPNTITAGNCKLLATVYGDRD